MIKQKNCKPEMKIIKDKMKIATFDRLMRESGYTTMLIEGCDTLLIPESLIKEMAEKSAPVPKWVKET